MMKMPINTAFKDSVTCNRVTQGCQPTQSRNREKRSEVKVTRLQLHTSRNIVSMGFDDKFKCNPIKL